MFNKYCTLSILAMSLTMLAACGPHLSDAPPLKHADYSMVAAEEVLPPEATCPESDKTPDKITREVPDSADTTFEDHDKELKDFTTTFVVKEFFKSEDTLFSFMKLVYGTIEADLKNYRQARGLDEQAIIFMFKGGNVLRIVANQVMNMLPPAARNLLQKSYGENFKRSDADFSILVDETKLKDLGYETIMAELIQLTYESLNKIRDEITQNKETYFNFLQLKSTLTQKGLQQYFAKLKDLEAVSNPENSKWYQVNFAQLQLVNTAATANLKCTYEGQFDYRYEFDPNDKNKIIGTPLTKQPNWIMNTINTTLGWPFASDPTKLIKFSLVRSKIQFEYSYIKDGTILRSPIGGELIDVSFPHRTDDNLKEFLKNSSTWLADYTLTLDETKDSLTIRAESLEGLAADLNALILEQYSRPWDAPKYQKRLNRLFFFAIADILGSVGAGSDELKNYLDSVKKEIIEPLQLFMENDDRSDIAEQLLKSSEDLKALYPQLPIANTIWHGVSVLVAERMLKKPLEGDEENFKEFLEVIKTNLVVIEQLTQMPHAKIDIKEIYNVKMSSYL